MNNITRSLLVPALAVALPCLAFAQSGTSSSSSSQRDATGASSNYSSTSDSKSGIHRVTEQQLESQMTAKSLIGTDVHGSKGEKIGEVVDVVLAPSRNAHAASTGASSSTYQSSDVTSSTTRSATAGTPERSHDKTSMNNMSKMQGMQPAVIISTGGMMGVGNDLVRVPISRISYDANEEEIRLNVTETEWNALRNAPATGGVTSTTR